MGRLTGRSQLKKTGRHSSKPSLTIGPEKRVWHLSRDQMPSLRENVVPCRLAGTCAAWIHHSVEDGTLYISIRFQDKTDFALEFSPQIVRVGTELCDSATDDFDVIRNYYREERE